MTFTSERGNSNNTAEIQAMVAYTATTLAELNAHDYSVADLGKAVRVEADPLGFSGLMLLQSFSVPPSVTPSFITLNPGSSFEFAVAAPIALGFTSSASVVATALAGDLTLSLSGPGGTPPDGMTFEAKNGTNAVTNDIILDANTKTFADTGLSTLTFGAAKFASGTFTGFAPGVLNFTSGDTVNAGGKVYTFTSPLGAVDGDILLGATYALSMASIFEAITLFGPGSGVTYAVATGANAFVTASAPTASAITITALASGVAGNALASVYTAAGVAAGAWGGATLAGGVDAVAFGAAKVQYSAALDQWVILNIHP